jgi:hypothetical protein
MMIETNFASMMHPASQLSAQLIQGTIHATSGHSPTTLEREFRVRCNIAL